MPQDTTLTKRRRAWRRLLSRHQQKIPYIYSRWASGRPTTQRDRTIAEDFGFRNNFSYDIQRYVSNDQACDNLPGNKDWYEMWAFVEFLRSITAGTASSLYRCVVEELPDPNSTILSYGGTTITFGAEKIPLTNCRIPSHYSIRSRGIAAFRFENTGSRKCNHYMWGRENDNT
jgi:hypothetical protein